MVLEDRKLFGAIEQWLRSVWNPRMNEPTRLTEGSHSGLATGFKRQIKAKLGLNPYGRHHYEHSIWEKGKPLK